MDRSSEKYTRLYKQYSKMSLDELKEVTVKNGYTADAVTVANDCMREQNYVIEDKDIYDCYNDESDKDINIKTYSTVAFLIKMISIIILILSFIGSILIFMDFDRIYGMVGLLLSAMVCLVAYGIGEIIDVLVSINNKLR